MFGVNRAENGAIFDSFLTTPKKTQQSILTFAVKTPPFKFVHRPSPPRKRQLMENRGPGRPKKKLREDWRQKWYDAAESKSYSSIEVYMGVVRSCDHQLPHR